MIARLAALPIALFGLLLGAPAFAALEPAVREAAARSVVQVRALDCAGADKAATGFVYGAADQVVTAHHVVAGCRRFAVFFEYLGGRTVTAEVERTLAEADLALLRLAEGPAPALRRVSAPARVDDRLEALGYSLGRRSMSNTPVTVRFGSDRLASILTAPVARELRASTRIDLDMRILRLDGHLLPGLSGAPILSTSGEVAGVGGGGLKQGAASISYAVPAEALDRLMASGEVQTAALGDADALYAAPAPEAADRAAERLVCGGFEFVETGRRSFAELSLAVDDPVGLQTLLGLANLDPAVLNGFSYRIFTPLAGGAAVAVPDWMEVESYGDHCLAEGLDGALRVEFGGQAVGSPLDLQFASVAFENGFIARSGRFWRPDPNLSYFAPLTRFDGMLATRKTILGFDQAGGVALGFETLLNRGTEFTGVVAISDWWSVDVVNFCAAQPFAPDCDEVNEYLTLVAQAILGAHMSTFPVI